MQQNYLLFFLLFLPTTSSCSLWTCKDFHDYDTITSQLKKWHAEYPDITEIYDIGKSYENRSTLLLKIGLNDNAPGIFLEAGIHAREWGAISSTLYVIEKLLLHSQDETEKLLQHLNWYILPTANPDGYQFSRDHFRYWRKTRSFCEDENDSCCGVDGNRNFGYKWGGEGSSGDPCHPTFRGRHQFSVPETQNIETFVTQKISTLVAYFAIHTPGPNQPSWLIPFSDEAGTRPDDFAELESMAITAAGRIYDINGTNFTVGNSREIFYPVTGGSDDWAKDSMGIKYAYTLELRPGKTEENCTSRLPEWLCRLKMFELPKEEIALSGEELFVGLEAFI